MKKLQVYIGNKNIYTSKADNSAIFHHLVDNVFHFFPEATHAVVFNLENGTHSILCREKNIATYLIRLADTEEYMFDHFEAALNAYNDFTAKGYEPHFEIISIWKRGI